MAKTTPRLTSDHLKPSGVKLGPQTGGLVPCSRSKEHGHHPAAERCGWCEPEADKRPWDDLFDYYWSQP